MITSDGIVYGAPSLAKPWGSRGCPVVPRAIREELASVAVPPQLGRVFGEGLKYGDLNSEIIGRLNSDELPKRAKQLVGEQLNMSALLPSSHVALPSGIPLSWFETLPVSGWVRNAVGRAFQARAEDNELKSPMLVSEFSKLKSVGNGTIIELLCVMESAEVRPNATESMKDAKSRRRAVAAAAEEWDAEKSLQKRLATVSPMMEQIAKFASWSQAETDATTFQQAIREAVSQPDKLENWSGIFAVPLERLSPVAPHPYVLIEAWTKKLSELEAEVFEHRLGSKEKQTLENIATRFNLTRERIRQIESRLKRKFHGFLASDDAEPIRWRAATIRSRVGAAAPTRAIEPLKTPPDNTNDYTAALLDFAGLGVEGEWIISKELRVVDVNGKILAHADEFGRLDRAVVAAELATAGFDPSFHSEWLAKEPEIREFNGELVVWGRSAKDRLVFALADLNREATVDELLDHLGEDISRGYALNAVAADERVVRVDRSRYALKTWGLIEYKGIAQAIRQLISDTSRPVNIDDACVKISQQFGVSEVSVRWYMEAPMFVIEGSYVRLRSDDEPFQFDYKPVRDTRGVFALGSRRVALLLPVDQDMLRGSGRMLPNAAGGILKIEVGDEIELTSDQGGAITITYPASSNLGPSMGSSRVFAEKLGARPEDHLTVVMDLDRRSVETRLTRSGDATESWDFVAHLTGIDADAGLAGLAKALDCDRGEVRAILRKRGDHLVLQAIPQAPTSAKLAEALGDLRDQISRTNRS